MNENEIVLNSEFNFDGYQVVRREFFAHLNEPSVTFNNYKFYANTACLKRFPNVYFVQALVNKDKKILALRPCSKNDRDAFMWKSEKNGKFKVKPITCKLFFAKLFELMDWNIDYRYKLLGRVIHANNEILIVFDLTSTETYERIVKDGEKTKTMRKAVFPSNWQNEFGLQYNEHRKSMQIDIFEGYAIYSIKNNILNSETESDL